MSELQTLFNQQQEFINYFFEHFDATEYEKLTTRITNCSGMVLVSGVGKSSSIANLFSDILVSLSIRSRFLSPVNALHGDIGIVGPDDIFVLISKSGETDELRQLIPYIKLRGTFTVSLVCVRNSTLWNLCDLPLELPLKKELCPFNMAPVTSSIIQLLFCNTIAVACMQMKKFPLEHYALNHPAGTIGKRLCLRARDVMLKDFPSCPADAPLKDALASMSVCGAVIPLNEDGTMAGIFTDGDLRRALDHQYDNIMKMPICSLVVHNPVTCLPNDMAYELSKLMRRKKIHQVVVVEGTRVVGLVLERELNKIGI